MIAVKLMGGLGNQMFQYAAGRALAVRRGTALKLDLTLYEGGGSQWPYELERFETTAPGITAKEVAELPGPPPTTWKGRAKRMVRPKPFKLVAERGFSFEMYGLVGDESGRIGRFSANVLSAPRNAYLVGFWQSEKYFADAVELIRNDFVFKSPLEGDNLAMADKIRSTAAVSLHVRRGDYVSKEVVNK